MAGDSSCCCLHIKTCGITVGILGTIFGILACIGSYQVITSLPWAILVLVTFIIIIAGIGRKNPGYLLVAEIFLGFRIGACILSAIIIMCFGRGTDELSMWTYRRIEDDPSFRDNNMSATEQRKYWSFITDVVMIVAAIFEACCLAYSCIVVHRLRKWIQSEMASDAPATPSAPSAPAAPAQIPQYHSPPPVIVTLHGPKEPEQNAIPSAPPQQHHQPRHSYAAPPPPPPLPHGYPTETTMYPNLDNANTQPNTTQ